MSRSSANLLPRLYGLPLISSTHIQLLMSALSYTERCQQVFAHRPGIWNVYAGRQRQGSPDRSVTHTAVNDFGNARNSGES